jgi:NitT/TauT family transport system ATP-binding protein
MSDLLCLHGVTLTYHAPEGETLAIKDLSFCLKEREFLTIVGPSGCGKTSVLSLISGLMRPTSGDIFYKGQPVASARRDVPLNVGYMLQRDQLFEWRTIRENVMLGLEICRKKNKDSTARVDALLQKYGLYAFRNHYPRQLSGGMRQRVALIRTLATDPGILLLDEPFSALDYQTRMAVCDDVHRIIKGEQKSAVLVTHDLSEAVAMSDRVVVLSHRPAVVKAIHKTVFEGCPTPLKRRENRRFPVYFDRLWKDLEVDASMEDTNENTHKNT